MLRQLVTQRFGEVSEALWQSIDWATDVDGLTTVALQVFHVATPQDLRLAPGAGGTTTARSQLTAMAAVVGGPLVDILADVGWEMGYAEGELAMARRLLRQLLADRFGNVHEVDVQRIESATDVKVLTRAVLQAYCIAAPKYLQL